MGTELPDTSWQQAAVRLREAAPAVPIVAVSHCNDPGHVARLLTHGFVGCVGDEEATDDLIDLLDVVAEGNVRFSRCVLQKLFHSRLPDATLAELSRRQRDLLHLLASGHDNRRIAEALFLSEGTVRNYVSDLYQQIGVESRTEAALWAWRHGVAQDA